MTPHVLPQTDLPGQLQLQPLRGDPPPRRIDELVSHEGEPHPSVFLELFEPLALGTVECKTHRVGECPEVSVAEPLPGQHPSTNRFPIEGSQSTQESAIGLPLRDERLVVDGRRGDARSTSATPI